MLPKRKLGIGLAAAAAFSIGVLGIAAPAAQAATFTYADGISTPENQAHNSGSRATISGGEAWTTLGLGTTTLIIFYPAPGYNEVGFANGSNPARVGLSHDTYMNAQSKCYWHANNVGGNADITCSAFS
jgi:hypothetical protein